MPALGWTKPQMTLNRVVFPAPFGPMTPTTSLWADRHRHLVEGQDPPKPTLTCSTTRRAAPRRTSSCAGVVEASRIGAHRRPYPGREAVRIPPGRAPRAVMPTSPPASPGTLQPSTQDAGKSQE